MNAHLNQGTCGANQNNVIKRDITSKIARRNSKKHRNRISKVSPGTSFTFASCTFVMKQTCQNSIRPIAGRLFDYFDAGIMERLRHQLLFSQLSQKHCGVVFVNGKVTVKSEVSNFCLFKAVISFIICYLQVIARRLDTCGKPRVLLRWYPENM